MKEWTRKLNRESTILGSGNEKLEEHGNNQLFGAVNGHYPDRTLHSLLTTRQKTDFCRAVLMVLASVVDS